MYIVFSMPSSLLLQGKWVLLGLWEGTKLRILPYGHGVYNSNNSISTVFSSFI